MLEREPERILRGILHDAYPGALAKAALSLATLDPDIHVLIPIPGRAEGIEVSAADLAAILREELDRRFAKSADHTGRGT